MTYEEQVRYIEARLAMAKDLETHRAVFLKDIDKYPIEITSQDGSDPFFRVVIDSESELDLVISQLKAPLVRPEEAHNQSLVWPRPDK